VCVCEREKEEGNDNQNNVVGAFVIDGCSISVSLSVCLFVDHRAGHTSA